MKKLYCLLLSTTLALIGLTPAHAQKATSQVKPITIQKARMRGMGNKTPQSKPFIYHY